MTTNLNAWDSMYLDPPQNTVTITTMDAKHTVPVHTDIINTGRITTNPNRMYDSHKHITVKKVRPEPGETWHYKVPGASALSTGYVVEVTAHTVLISPSKWSTEGVRYVTDEVEFIEKK